MVYMGDGLRCERNKMTEPDMIQEECRKWLEASYRNDVKDLTEFVKDHRIAELRCVLLEIKTKNPEITHDDVGLWKVIELIEKRLLDVWGTSS
jgi:hypothetical protein